MTNATITAPRRAQALGWTLSEAPRDAHCNFHRDRPAIFAYAGTPLCAECAERMTPDA
jgi:hypothetical protein